MHDPGHSGATHAGAAHGHHDGHGSEHGQGDEHGHGGVAKYMYVFLALCGLTTMSFFTYSDFWPKSLDDDHVKWLFMMAVSCTKAMLVVLFFMHVKYEANWKYVLTIPASIMAVFLVMALVPDIGLRVKTYAEERLRRTAGPEDVEELREASHHQAGGSHAGPHEAGGAEGMSAGHEHDDAADEAAPADDAEHPTPAEEHEPAAEPDAAAPSDAATEGGADEESTTEEPSEDATEPSAE